MQVHYSAVNPVDLGTRAGRTVPPEAAQFPMVLGWDAYGTVEAVGEDVTDLSAGDGVIVCVQQPATQQGTHADRLVVDRNNTALAPAGWDDGRATGLGLSGITALQAVDALHLQPGDTLLVNNPAGFVGGLAAQIAAAQGATVIGVAPPDVQAHAPAQGTRLFAALDDVRQAHPNGVTAALDLVGGTVAQQTFALVRADGRYATIIPHWWKPGGPYTPARGITPVVVENHPNARDLARLADLAAHGHLTVESAARYALTDLARAHDLLAGSGVFGKVVIRH